MTDCRHQCCEIRENPYHEHPVPAEGCLACLRLAVAGYRLRPGVRRTTPAPAIDPDHPEAAPRPAGDAEVERMATEVAQIVRTVLTRIVPELDGLTAGSKLDQRVLSQTISTYLDADDDPDLRALDSRLRITVLAGRVGLALAFRN